MADNVAVQFVRSSAPYEAGDVAGFPSLQAQSLVDRGIAAFWPAKSAAPADQFTAMDRAALVAFARDKLGMTDDPPATVSDDQLRDALRRQAAQPAAPVTPAADASAPATTANAAAAPAAPAAAAPAADTSKAAKTAKGQ